MITSAPKSKNRSCRIRRFFCELCGITETIYGEGYRDLIGDPMSAKAQIEEYFKQEEKNRYE